MKCSKCGRLMVEKKDETPEGVSYSYYKCKHCGEEILDMKQLHAIAEKYRKIKHYNVRITKWGVSIGIRIPKELVQKYHLTKRKEITMIPQEKAIKLIVD